MVFFNYAGEFSRLLPGKCQASTTTDSGIVIQRCNVVVKLPKTEGSQWGGNFSLKDTARGAENEKIIPIEGKFFLRGTLNARKCRFHSLTPFDAVRKIPLVEYCVLADRHRRNNR